MASDARANFALNAKARGLPNVCRPVCCGQRSAHDLRRSMRLYAVTDSTWLAGRSLADCVAQALEGGVTFVQLREKHLSTREIVALASTIVPLCHAAGVPFVINDDVEAALLSGADGVHVGQSDTACAEARRILGSDAIVGVSAQTVEQALAAEAAGADYLGVGALFKTDTKADAAVVSREELAAMCAAVSIPVVGIGGLNASTVSILDETGACGAAVVSALFAKDDIRAAARTLRFVLDGLSLG